MIMSADHSESSNLPTAGSTDITTEVVNSSNNDDQSDIAQKLASYATALKAGLNH